MHLFQDSNYSGNPSVNPAPAGWAAWADETRLRKKRAMQSWTLYASPDWFFMLGQTGVCYLINDDHGPLIEYYAYEALKLSLDRRCERMRVKSEQDWVTIRASRIALNALFNRRVQDAVLNNKVHGIVWWFRLRSKLGIILKVGKIARFCVGLLNEIRFRPGGTGATACIDRLVRMSAACHSDGAPGIAPRFVA